MTSLQTKNANATTDTTSKDIKTEQIKIGVYTAIIAIFIGLFYYLIVYKYRKDDGYGYT